MKWCATFLFLFFMGLYLHGMAPTVTVGDAGEFMAASIILGLPHPPAYPLFSLCGKAVSLVVPWGALAYRVNILSALLGAMTVSLMALAAYGATKSKTSAWVGAIVLAVSPVFWQNSQVTEVFILTAFFAVLLLLVAFSTLSDEKKIFCSCFLLALGLGNHHTLLLMSPGLLFLLWRPKTMKHVLVLSILFVALGLSVYGYLPVRSSQTPALDWGHPVDWPRFWRVFSRADYGSLSLTTGEKLPRNLSSALEQMKRFFEGQALEMTWMGLVMGLLGLGFWIKERPRQGVAVALIALLAGPGFLLLGNMPFDAQSQGVLERFYLLPLIPLILGMGKILKILSERFPTLRPLLWALPLLLLFRPVGFSQRSNFVSYDYGKNLLKTLEPQAILFMDGGDDTFYTLAYLHLAEKRRPDLELHDRGGLIYQNIYGADFRRLSKTEKQQRRIQVEKTFVGVRPVYYSTFNKDVLPQIVQKQRGILYETGDETSQNLWPFYSRRAIKGPWNRDYRTRALTTVYDFMQGMESWDNNNASGALPYFDRALTLGPDVLWLTANLSLEFVRYGAQMVQQGRLEEAEAFLKRALAIHPKDALAIVNLGVLAERRGQKDQAKSYYEQAIAMDPSYADAYFNLGTVYWHEGNWPKVMEYYQKALAVDPQHERARLFLEKAKALAKQ